MESMIVLWQRIEQWLVVHAPQILNQLNPGASEAEIAEVEATLGFALPEDFKASYRIHNGGGAGILALAGMSQGLLPLSDIAGFWLMYGQINIDEINNDKPGFVTDPSRTHPPIQPVMWHSRFIEFAQDGAGNRLCLDLAPAPGGHVGQVIDYDNGDGPTWVLAPSFEALLSQWADGMEANHYQVGAYGGRSLEMTNEGYVEWMMAYDKPRWKEVEPQVNSEEAMTGFISYCENCQEEREVKEMHEIFMRNGQSIRSGQCSVCGARMSIPAPSPPKIVE